MVHPALLNSRSMMNLGQMLSQAPDSPMTSSPGPPGPQEHPRGVSLAEAMQAARRLNLEKEQGRQRLLEDSNVVLHEEADSEMAVKNINGGRLMILKCEAGDGGDEAPEPSEDINCPEKEKSWDDLAKNIEIRRLSSTDDGNKVLEATFHSPDKDKKKNPLMNIFNIVSGMDAVPQVTEEYQPRCPPSMGPNTPIPTALGTLRPQLRGRRARQYSTLPPLPHSPPPWVMGGQARPGVGSQQIVLAPQMMMQGMVQPGQQVMQLVHTVNGTMLVPMGPQQQMVQVQTQGPALLSQAGHRTLSSATSAPASMTSSPTGGITMRPKSQTSDASAGAPLLAAPMENLVNFQNVSQSVSGTQMMTMTQAGQGPGAQLLVGGQGMQGMILMPQPHGSMYQQ
jgi:hypothetical protein